MFKSAQIIANNSTANLGALTFAFNSVPGYTNWTALFDRYRINSVTITFRAVGVQMNTTPVTYSIPEFLTVVDIDDAATPTSMDQLRKYATCCSILANRDIVRSFQPRTGIATYDGLTTAYTLGDPDMWLDLANPDIPHYGLKYGIDAATPTATAAIYDVFIEYNVELSGQRGS
jgi:hypothetical protein